MISSRVILAAVSSDQGSVLALRRAESLRRLFDCELHVVHVLPNRVSPLVVNEDDAKRQLIHWAKMEAGIRIDQRPDRIHVQIGSDTAQSIREVASKILAGLIVIGAPSKQVDSPLFSLAAWPSWSLLVAESPRNSKHMIAATDLKDHRFPIVRAAAKLAAVADLEMTVLHNAEEDAVARLTILQKLSEELDGAIRYTRVATTSSTASAIKEIAETRDADLVVVGLRRGHSRTFASVISEVSCSILAVPIMG